MPRRNGASAPTSTTRSNGDATDAPAEQTLSTLTEPTHPSTRNLNTPKPGRPHGSYARYVLERCRCDRCRQAKRNYERARTRRAEPAYVSAGSAREHLAWLRTQHIGLKTVARRSGVAHGTLSKLVHGTSNPPRPPSRRIRPATLGAILAVRPDSHHDGTRTDASPVWAMVNELVAAGVARAQIARRLGQRGALQLGATLVTRRNAAAVRAMHAELVAGTLKIERRSRWGSTTQPAVPNTRTTTTCGRPSIGRYTKGRCKCDECRALASEKRQRQRARDPEDDPILALVVILEARIDEAGWRCRAACTGVACWVFHPADDDEITLQAARDVCGGCPVRRQCLDTHIDEPDGLFGGLTAVERRGLKRVRALLDRHPPDGTVVIVAASA